MPRLLPVYPSREEVHRMIVACRNPRDSMLLKLLWHTGGRISEVLDARVGDTTNSGLRMTNLKQGGPAQKHVFLSLDFLSELQTWCSNKPLGAPIVGRLHDGKSMSRVRGWQIVKEAGARAGIWKRRYGDSALEAPWPHTLRHGSAIFLLENGVPINAVKGQLGHATLAATAIYLELADADRAAMIGKIRF